MCSLLRSENLRAPGTMSSQFSNAPGLVYTQNWQLGVDIVVNYDDVIMTMLTSQITSLMVVYSIVYLGVNQRKHQSSASLAFVREIHRGPVNFPHKWPVTRKMFPLDDVIMKLSATYNLSNWELYLPIKGHWVHCKHIYTCVFLGLHGVMGLNLFKQHETSLKTYLYFYCYIVNDCGIELCPIT